MTAPKGNKYWQLRKSHGCPHKYETPDILWDACMKYFDWLEENPIVTVKATQHQGEQVDLIEAKPRAPTVAGLCVFLNIHQGTWYDYEKSPLLGETALQIKDIMFANKFEGASAGIFNPAIIARDLGLADKKEHSSPDGTMTPTKIEIVAPSCDNKED